MCALLTNQCGHGMSVSGMPNPEEITGVKEEELPIFRWSNQDTSLDRELGSLPTPLPYRYTNRMALLHDRGVAGIGKTVIYS